MCLGHDSLGKLVCAASLQLQADEGADVFAVIRAQVDFHLGSEQVPEHAGVVTRRDDETDTGEIAKERGQGTRAVCACLVKRVDEDDDAVGGTVVEQTTERLHDPARECALAAECVEYDSYARYGGARGHGTRRDRDAADPDLRRERRITLIRETRHRLCELIGQTLRDRDEIRFAGAAKDSGREPVRRPRG